jgi:hypothetical protein
LEQTSDSIRASRYAVNALMVMVAGLITVAVANEEVITHAQLSIAMLKSSPPAFRFLRKQAILFLRLNNGPTDPSQVMLDNTKNRLIS